MEESLRIVVGIAALVIFFSILQLLRKGRIPVKFSLLWGVVVIALLLVAIIPNSLISFMRILGFQTLSNLIVGLLFLILFFMTISLTVIISGQKTKINLLIQELSMLKKKIDENDK